MFLTCTKMITTPISVDKILKENTQDQIVKLVIQLLEFCASMTTNSVDDLLVAMIKRKLLNEPIPAVDVWKIMQLILGDLPDEIMSKELKVVLPILFRPVEDRI